MPRPTDWIDNTGGVVTLAGGLGKLDLTAAFSQTDLRGVTLIRTLVELGAYSTTIAGAYGVSTLYMGIGIAARDAFPVTGAIPDPGSGSEKPPRGWIWRASVQVTQNGIGTSIVTHVRYDIRGARKIEAGIVYLVTKNVTQVGTAFTINLSGVVRLLTKLP